MRIIFLVVLFLTSRLISQEFSFKNFSVEEGLPQSQVVTCFQDKTGYLWFGTQSGGVAKFDGKSFQIFNAKTGLPNNSVQSIYQDKKGNYWFATEEGLSNFDGRQFWNYGKSYGITKVNKVIGDIAGNIWFGDYNKGLFLYDGKKFTRYTTKDGLISNNIRDLVFTRDNRLLIATNSGLSIFDGKRFTNYNKDNGLLANSTRGVIEDKNSNLWVGHLTGISVIDPSGKIRTITQKNGLLYNQVLDVFEDSKGEIWISAIGGLCRYDGKKFWDVKTSEDLHNKRVYEVIEDREGNIWAATDTKGASRLIRTSFTHFSDKDGLANNNVWEICEDKNGMLWFATDRGISRFDGKKFLTYNINAIPEEDIIFCLFYDERNTLWAGTNFGLAKFDGYRFRKIPDPGKAFKDEAIVDIISDAAGNIYCGTFNGIVKFDGNKFEHFAIEDSLLIAVYELYRDNQDMIWIGTEYNGLYIYDGKKLSKFHIEGFPHDNKIWNVAQDSQNNFWFGLTENGLVRYNRTTKKHDLITSENGLIDDNILSMNFDRNDNMWIGTNRGVSRLDVGEYNRTGKIIISNYGKDEGFLSVECNQNSQHIDVAGSVWFGTIGGTSKYTPGVYPERHNDILPNTVILGMKIFNESFETEGISDGINPATGLPINLRLKHNQSNVSFDFRGLSFINSEKVKYRYRLVGLSNQWSPVTRMNTVNYSNLTPGNYTFEVISCNNENVWNYTPASLSFEIITPFWKRLWFYIFIVIVLSAGIFGYVKFRTYKLIHQKQDLEKIIDERTQQLQAEKEKVEEVNQELEQINSELAKINKELEFSNIELEKLSIVARQTDNSIYIFNSKGDLEWLNSGAARMIGYTFDQIITEKGKSIVEVSAYPEIENLVKEAIELKRSINYEVINNNRNGNSYWGSCTLTPIFGEDESLEKLVVIETDITQLKIIEEKLVEAHNALEKRVEERTAELMESNRLLKQQISIREWTERELIKAKDKAEQADRLKSAFLAQMSHEIRTPLNVILSYTSLLKEEFANKMDDIFKSVFFGINNAGRRLIRTIDLILNMSAIQSGTHDIQIRSFSLNNSLEALISEFSSLINNKSLKLVFNNLIGEVCINADEYSINQVFQNLIDNAIKFTPAGEVEIRLYKNSRGYTCVDVRDEGIGISEDYLPHLFKPFMQEEIGYTRKFEGNGLGLALVKNYIELNNADIDVESEKGKGTKFTITFK